jgi:V/A-type H+-transporting ATPase subunit A
MMKVVGEEGTSLEDFLVYLKGEYLDAVYLQQDAFDPVDGATGAERQRYFFAYMMRVIDQDFQFADKESARAFFQRLIQATRDWNRIPFDSSEFKEAEQRLHGMLAQVRRHV